VVNTFVMLLSRVIGNLVDKVVFKTERGTGPEFFITMIIAEMVLGILASIIVMWFSRQREFRADSDGAHHAGRGAMIAISGRVGGGLKRLFMTHPPLEERMPRSGSATDKRASWRCLEFEVE
jgi:heat shock protein HtpX